MCLLALANQGKYWKIFLNTALSPEWTHLRILVVGEYKLTVQKWLWFNTELKITQLRQ